MKLDKYILPIALAVSTLNFSSCNDFLDRHPQGQFTEDDNPGALAEEEVFNIYTMMRDYNITAGIPAFAIEYFRSKDSGKGNTASGDADQAVMYDDFQYNTNNGLIKAYWSQSYAIIYRCNGVIEAIEKGNLTEENDLRNKGETLFFHAYCHFNLVRAFGEMPLVTFKVNDAPKADIPRTTAEEIYKQTGSDPIQTEELLPRQWQSAYLGRLAWGSTRALHAHTYIMRNDRQNIYTASTDIVNSEQYNLGTPCDVIFTDDGENSSESVFELQCASTAALPTSDKIGSQFCEAQGVHGSDRWDLDWGWYMGTELMGEVFEPGDPRKDATLLYFRRSDDDPITPEDANKPYGESPVSQADGTYFNKEAYTSPALREEFTRRGFWMNIRIIRYGDVVLMATESANELGKTDETSGYLEMVRARARGNNPDVLLKMASLDQIVLYDATRHERRVELGLESGHFYGLIYWGIASQVLHTAGETGYQPKNALLPLPRDEIDKPEGVLMQSLDY